MDRLLTPAEAAELLGVTEGALAQWRFRRMGPAYTKLNERAVRYTHAQLEEWVSLRTINRAPE
ncbi:helix-turn-helix domain-containing protein [Aeromicrobium sp. SMF47]|uniref:helix-turn-helix transcriptional regulator n=1 Tax=Aeromicrobium yanjiei TaxID=2662028 RepID=UPI00129D85FF|nr:helix-turn-helix domain-containing protein [Aeromicrobium yanjiei]